MPIHAANTNPDVVAAVVQARVRRGREEGRRRRRLLQRSEPLLPALGHLARGVRRSGAEVVLPAEHRFRTMRLKGDVLDEWPVFTTLVDADKVINVPVAKHHNLAKFTAAMKNWYGVLGGRRNRLHQNIDMSIADLATFMRPTLVVIDAMARAHAQRPAGRQHRRRAGTCTPSIATVDQVAADAFGCTLIGQKRENSPYLEMGHERGLGTMHWENLRVREV